MGTVVSQITSLTIVHTTVYSDADQSKHQSSASLAFVWGIHRGPVNFPHKWPVTREMLPFDDVIMFFVICWLDYECFDVYGETTLNFVFVRLIDSLFNVLLYVYSKTAIAVT